MYVVLFNKMSKRKLDLLNGWAQLGAYYTASTVSLVALEGRRPVLSSLNYTVDSSQKYYVSSLWEV